MSSNKRKEESFLNQILVREPILKGAIFTVTSATLAIDFRNAPC